ncbi:MAG: DNA alkylation repair protein [Acidobacteria bacterium]|nr:DNA alkylation repair protein [Acidobacteriota bacterium]
MARPTYSSPAEVPAGLRGQLSRGEIESATLGEGLAVDFTTLLRTLGVAAEIDPGLGITRRMTLAAEALLSFHGALERHPSDTVRGWAAFRVGLRPGWSLEQRLEAVRPLAQDPHFGVREWAWLGIRPAIAAEVERAIALLTAWAEAEPYLRRFASEATRPRGVWCPHIPLLKKNPALGLPVLDRCVGEASKYVRDSVGNWMNDAAKTRPDWVRETCARWNVEAVTRRALRSIA